MVAVSLIFYYDYLEYLTILFKCPLHLRLTPILQMLYHLLKYFSECLSLPPKLISASISCFAKYSRVLLEATWILLVSNDLEILSAYEAIHLEFKWLLRAEIVMMSIRIIKRLFCFYYDSIKLLSEIIKKTQASLVKFQIYYKKAYLN